MSASTEHLGRRWDWKDNSGLVEAYQAIEHHVLGSAETRVFGLSEMLNECESPVEAMLFIRMFEMFHLEFQPPGGDFQNWFARIHRSLCEGFCEIRIHPQTTIGPFRTDFLFRALYLDSKGVFTPHDFLVEIDGHDWHEKTKSAVSRGKARDRYFMKSGIPVLHFTGSDIYRNAGDGCEEIYSYIQKASERLPQTG